jgi:3-dehydrosphinganine reductase
MFGYTAYGASKWAVRGFTDILRYEMKPHGITVHLVMPPDTDTPQLASEEPLKPFETKVIVGNGKVMPPEKVAGDILDGVKKNRYLIITGVQAVLIYWLTNLLGPLQYPVMDLLVADAVKKRKQAEEAAAKRV